MSKFCTYCGKPMAADAAFCTECGGQVSTQQTVATPVNHSNVKSDDTVSLWAYFGLILLFSLPVIGWIGCIIFAFAPQSKNIKNFSRAYLIIMAILLVITILLACVIGTLVFNMVDSVGDGFFREFGGVSQQLQQQTDLINPLQNSGTYSLPLD